MDITGKVQAIVEKGKLMLGTWQQVVFIELDVRPRHRTVLVQLMGE